MVLVNHMATSIAIMELVDITNAVDRGTFTIGVFIDLKKTFDTYVLMVYNLIIPL